MNKVVVFDLGKVLLDFDYWIAATNLAKQSRVDAVAIRGTLFQTSLLVDYELGLFDSNEFFTRFRDATGYCGSPDEFGRVFGDIFTPIDKMIALHATLRRANVPTYIFSNTNELAVRHISRTFLFFAHFDGYVLSYEERSMKPDVPIYEAVERLTQRAGADIVYIDDRPENIATGRARGWNTILQQSPEQTWEALAPFIPGHILV